MNFIQKIRASHVNRHGFMDALVGVVVFQAMNVALIAIFGNLDQESEGEAQHSLEKIAFYMLIFAPLFENLFMIGAAAIHEELFGRRFLFVATPLLMTALHFTTPHELPFPTTIRVIELFGFFYVYLKQYDLHKLEIGKPKALFLSSLLHFACNATVLLTLLIFDFVIDAETTFSAQPGE
jgi:membrane protease YdiL (CAAX protease family)